MHLHTPENAFKGELTLRKGIAHFNAFERRSQIQCRTAHPLLDVHP